MALLTHVGSFAKRTSTGSQSITGVGFTPKAILFWSAGESSDGSWSTHYVPMLGFTTGPTESFSTGAVSQTAVAVSNTSRRSAEKAIVFVLWGETTIGEADLTSFDADGFTLNWTTASIDALRVHYLALGGSDLTDAKAINWQASTGTQAVTGVGFQPDCVLHITDAYPTALPRSTTHATLSLGAMDKDGGQWANNFLSLDASGNADTQRGQRTDSCILGINNFFGIDFQAAYSSMDADGFTVDWLNPPSGTSQILSLCLKGGKFKVGSFNKSTNTTTPAAQAVTGIPFQPTGLLLSSFQTTATTSVVADAMWGVGASDGTNEAASVLTDDDGAASTNVDRLGKESKVFVVANNVTQTINAEADLTSFNSNGFSLSWTTNHSSATQILYLAVGNGTSLIDETAGQVTVLAALSGTATVTLQESSGIVDALVTTEGIDTQTMEESAGKQVILAILSSSGGQTFNEASGQITLLTVLSGEDFKGFDETAGEVTILAVMSGLEQSVLAETSGVALLKGILAGTDTLAFYEESGEVLVLVQSAGIERLVTFLIDPIIGVFVSVDQPVTGTVYLDNPFSSFIRTTAR